MFYKHKGKWTLEDAKSVAGIIGYTLVDTYWYTVKHKYTFISPKGFKWICTWNNFIRGVRYPDDKEEEKQRSKIIQFLME